MSKKPFHEQFGVDLWKNPSETARLFRVSIRTIYRWRRLNVLPSAQVGGTHYFPLPLIQKMMLQRAKNSRGKMPDSE